MPYPVAGSTGWHPWGKEAVYRYLKLTATYDADEPWPTDDGRFDDATGARWTLYVSDSAEGAAAEFFRRNPELLDFQEDLLFRMYEMTLEITEDGLDVRVEPNAADIGFPFPRLTSSEEDETVRYRECRELADDVEAADGVGIAYPSAALDEHHNRVVFGDSGSTGWDLSTPVTVDVPRVAPDAVRILPDGS